jgi:hypothetical protein
MIVGCSTQDLRQKVCNHILGITKDEFDVAACNHSSYQVISDSNGVNLPESDGVRRNAQTRFRVSIDGIWFGAGESKELTHIFNVSHLFGTNTGPDRLSCTRRICYGRLLDQCPQDWRAIYVDHQACDAHLQFSNCKGSVTASLKPTWEKRGLVGSGIAGTARFN